MLTRIQNTILKIFEKELISSGKVPNKQDRSGAYMARYIAKNIVAADLADRCEVQLSYAIGFPEPISVLVETFGTIKCDEDKLVEAVRSVFDLTPAGIIKQLDLKRPMYKETAAYGHFGREEFSWERKDKVEALKEAVSTSGPTCTCNVPSHTGSHT